VKKAQANSANLHEWIHWMALDILLSLNWKIAYRYTYYDKKEKEIIARIHPIKPELSKRYPRLDACLIPEDKSIYISPLAKDDKALCLFHECMEILFTAWRDEYFVPRRWGLESGDDPILNLEKATWGKFSKEQKAAIRAFLPKEP